MREERKGAVVSNKTSATILPVAAIGSLILALAGCSDLGKRAGTPVPFEGVYTSVKSQAEVTLVMDSERFGIVLFASPHRAGTASASAQRDLDGTQAAGRDPVWTIVDGDVHATESSWNGRSRWPTML